MAAFLTSAGNPAASFSAADRISASHSTIGRYRFSGPSVLTTWKLLKISSNLQDLHIPSSWSYFARLDCCRKFKFFD
jgi:hypothetical protein